MLTVLGFDIHHAARAVEIESESKEQVQEMLESEGWTNIVFLED